MSPWLLLVLAVIAMYAAATISGRMYLRRLKRQREELSLEDFVASFPAGTDADVLRSTYDYLQSLTHGVMLPVSASDDLGEVYGIVDEDVWDELKEMAKKCGRRLPTEEEASRVVTVRDAVLLLASLGKAGAQEPLA